MKTYIKPEIEVLKIQLENMIAASGGSGTPGPSVFDGGTLKPSEMEIKEMIGFDFDENNFLSGDDLPIF